MVVHCLDSGILSLHFLKDTPKKISLLMEQVQSTPQNVYIPKEVILEVFKHLCVLKGHNYAQSVINSFYHAFKVNLVDLSPDLITLAGKLKCQYRSKLSYIDCIGIALSLEQGAIFHTTEKFLPKIPHLKIQTYEY